MYFHASRILCTHVRQGIGVTAIRNSSPASEREVCPQLVIISRF